ncbi:hypothetical protein LAZ67_22000137 [Cordylochernes scorpioides]|uniref:Uncharacterized protein n=1 Tax=Cordylochernes scorpioides TaxID=51811 RepID=A0ABY6LNH0_9ARAC|nr:hypothetical protein LAZ67_22000137 [Cordylochernes scorpioides]
MKAENSFQNSWFAEQRFLNHPPYSPDSAPREYYLFAHLKLFYCGIFKTDYQVKYAGIYKLPNLWKKCLEKREGYVKD